MEKGEQVLEKLVSMIFGVKEDLVRAETGADVGKYDLIVHFFTLRKRVGELAFMHVENGRGKFPIPEGFEVRKTHEVGQE